MENIMTKEEKIERFKKMNENIIPGQIICAGSSLMEMFPVEELAKEAKLNAIIYNRGVGGFVTAPLKDENGNLKAEYTIEGMHINEDGYRSIFPEFMKYV